MDAGSSARCDLRGTFDFAGVRGPPTWVISLSEKAPFVPTCSEQQPKLPYVLARAPSIFNASGFGIVAIAGASNNSYVTARFGFM